MSLQTMSSFPPIQSKSSATFYNQRVSVLGAVNRLKEIENKVLQNGNRELVQKRISQALMARQKGREQSQANKQAIRRSVDMDKSLRQTHLTQRTRQQCQLHSLASKSRQTSLTLRQDLQSAHKLHNSEMYCSAISQRRKNQQLIKQFKQRQMQLRRENRMKVAEGEQRSREKVRGFMEARAGEIRLRREHEVEELERRVMVKSRYLTSTATNSTQQQS